jgi:cytoskeletal protein CcmA (bactofilin family)
MTAAGIVDRNSLANDAERRLWDAFATGDEVDLGEGDPTAEGFDPSAWGDARTVRAEVIARLLLGGQPTRPGYVAKVVLGGAIITGELSLNEGEANYELAIDRCWLDTAPDFAGAITKSVAVVASRMPGLSATNWQAKGYALFMGSHFAGPVRLGGSAFRTQLSFDGGRITDCGPEVALSAEGITVDQDMSARDGFIADGGVRVVGAKIAGELSFNGARLGDGDGMALFADGISVAQDVFCGLGFIAHGVVRLSRARIGGSLDLTNATMTNEHGPALYADNVVIDGDLDCGSGFTANGEVRISRGQVRGEVDLRGSTLNNPDGDALDAYGLAVGKDMFCNGFHAQGTVRLLNAKIAGELDFSAATLAKPDGMALDAGNVGVGQDLTFGAGFASAGEVGISGAHVGQIGFHSVTLTHPEGDALDAYGLVVDRDLYCDRMEVSGRIDLSGSRVGGQVLLRGTLSNPEGSALSADNLVVAQDMSFLTPLTVSGELSISRARIGGRLLLDGRLTSSSSPALAADDLHVDGSVLFSEDLVTEGEVRLKGARIGGELSLDGKLSNPDGWALWADRLTVGQDLRCYETFVANGRVSLNSAQVGGVVAFDDAKITHAGSLALDLERLTARVLHLGSEVTGFVDLAQARLGVLSIPDHDRQPPTRLSGLVYGDLDPDPDPPVRRRIRWVRNDPAGFHPQPYEQLAGYYRGTGQDRQARQVLLAKSRSRRRATRTTWRPLGPLRYVVDFVRRIPGLLMDALAGYGYVPARAFCWLLIATAAGTLALRDTGVPGPAANDDLNAFLLALDSIVPTSPFGLRSQATLAGSAFAVTTALQILGYALTLALLPAVSRALSRSDK